MEGCPGRQETLLLDVYGELEAPGSADWYEHLRRCRACRQEKERLTGMLTHIKESLSRPELSPVDETVFTNRILRQSGGNAWKSSPSWFTRGKLIPGLIAASVLLAFGWFSSGIIGRNSSSQPTPEEKVIVENYEVLKDLDLLEEMDTVQRLIQVIDDRQVM